MWGVAWAPSINVRAPAAWAMSMICLIGLMVPSALETWVTATIRVRGLSNFWYSSMRSSPRSFMGMTRSLAPFSWHNICQGTMLEWCSMAEITISSSSCTFLRPQELVTRLMPSVAGSYTHLRAHETVLDLVWRLLIE